MKSCIEYLRRGEGYDDAKRFLNEIGQLRVFAGASSRSETVESIAPP